jgi:hypothetical protein
MNREPQHMGGLHLDEVLDGVGATEEEDIRQQWSVTSKVTEYLHMVVGCPIPKEPLFDYPEMTPKALTTTDSNAYMELYEKRTAWLTYLRQKLAEHQARLLEIEAEMDDIGRRIRTSERKHNQKTTAKGGLKAPSAQEMTDKIGRNPRYRELQTEKLFQKEVVLRLGARVDGTGDEQALHSRTVEIRRQEFEGTTRNSNVRGARGVPVTGGRGMGRRTT